MYGLTRRLLLVGLIAAAAATAVQVLAAAPAQPADATAPDVSGAWIVTVDAPQGRMDLETSFTQQGEQIVGEVTMPAGPLVFKGTLINQQLLVTYTAEAQGQPVELKFTGRATSDAMSGTVDLAGLMQVPWTAKRKPPRAEAAGAAAASSPSASPTLPGAAADVTGRWNIGVQVGPALLPLTATLTQQGEAVTGTITSPLGPLPVSGTMVGSALALTFTLALPQGPTTVTLQGQLGPAGLAGMSSVAGLGEAPWSATRVVQ